MDSFTYNNLDRHVLCICKTTKEMAFTMASLYEKKINTTQQKASQIRKDKTYLPYLQSQIIHIFTFLMFKY